jgi:hypothetical protein
MKMFAFMGKGEKNGQDTINYQQAEDIFEAAKLLLEDHRLYGNSPSFLFYYGVAYVADDLPRHLHLEGKAWTKNFQETVRLIKLGAVPSSYMYINGKWYKANESLFEQGVLLSDAERIMEEIRVLKGQIVQSVDAKRFRNESLFAVKPEKNPPKILTGVTEGIEPVHMTPYFRKQLDLVPDEPKIDYSSATKDIARRFS